MLQYCNAVEDAMLQYDGQSCHTGTAPFGFEATVCSVCGAQFKTASNMARHVQLVHERLYKFVCSICGKGTKTNLDLLGHMATRHKMPKPFRCQICEKEFAYNHRRIEHLKKFHRI